MNKVFVTAPGMGVGVEMEGRAAGLVSADEVEAKVRLVMESAEGMALRARAAARKEEARAATANGGPALVAFARFLKDMESLAPAAEQTSER